MIRSTDLFEVVELCKFQLEIHCFLDIFGIAQFQQLICLLQYTLHVDGIGLVPNSKINLKGLVSQVQTREIGFEGDID